MMLFLPQSFDEKIDSVLLKMRDGLEKHLFWVLCFLYVLYAGCLFLFCALEDWHLLRDAIVYLETAESASSEGFLHYSQDTFFPPLFVMCMVHAHHWLGISCKAAGFLICLSCGALCPILLFIITKRIFNDYVLAFLSGFLFFFMPDVRNVSTNILRDTPSLCMDLAAISCYVLFRQIKPAKRTKKYLFDFLCGFFLAVACGFRYENIEFLILLPLFHILLDLFKKTENSFGSLAKKEFCFLSWLLFGFLCGSAAVIVLCRNSDYFTMERFHLLKNRYVYFI